MSEAPNRGQVNTDQINQNRRRFMRNAAMTLAAAELVTISSAVAQPGSVLSSRARPQRWCFFQGSRSSLGGTPEIVLEVTSSNDPEDLIAGEYDAGVQLGEFIHRDMIAVPVTKEMRLAVVGSPEYFKSNTIPRHPQDLKEHSCIGFRFSNGLYRWEFEKGPKALTVSPQGPASFDDPDLVIQAVLDGVGIGTAMEDKLTELLAKGRLVQVLRDWCPSFPGYFLYYPSRRNQPAALAALIAALRLSE